MEYKLDLKDKRLLYELDSNARQTNAQIARKIGLSTEVVNYRIKRFEKENIITQYQTIVNLYKLDVLQFKICLSFQHITSSKLNQILDLLKKKQEIKWIVSCKGNWDLIISLETNSLESMDVLKDEILSIFSEYVAKKSISILVEAQTYNRDYLLDDKSQIHESRVIMKKDKSIKLNELDMKILKKLAENSRKPIVDIAHEIKSTVRIVNYRIKQLIKSKVILGFKIAINYEKLGIKFFKTFIYLDNPKKERLKLLIQYLSSHKNVTHHVKVLGNWDLEPEFEVYSEAEFDKVLESIKDKFYDIIKEIDVITILREHKFVYF